MKIFNICFFMVSTLCAFGNAGIMYSQGSDMGAAGWVVSAMLLFAAMLDKISNN